MAYEPNSKCGLAVVTCGKRELFTTLVDLLGNKDVLALLADYFPLLVVHVHAWSQWEADGKWHVVVRTLTVKDFAPNHRLRRELWNE
jgi:hypothetical protein